MNHVKFAPRVLAMGLLAASALSIPAFAAPADGSSTAIRVDRDPAPNSASQSVSANDSPVPVDPSQATGEIEVVYQDANGKEHSATISAVAAAPLEGITGWIFRQVHHAMFPGLSRYYTPFFAPTADSPLTGRGLRDMHPDHNRGVPVVPQLLTNRAEDFIASARLLQDLGYKEVNLNLGCPSGTVVAKKKGAGFLSQPQALARFLDQIFQTLDVNISIKTRIGVENLEEWPPLLDLFQRYPICELIIHPRLRRDFYRGQPRREAFTYAVAHSRLPLCYNGDLFSPQDCWDLVRQFPTVGRLMAGRGLVCNPALGRQLQGGPPLTKAELQAFHDRLLDGYQSVLSGDWPVLGKMKELWSYWARLFPAPEKPLKAMRKAKTLTDYTFAAQSLFRDQDLLPGAHFPSAGASS